MLTDIIRYADTSKMLWYMVSFVIEWNYTKMSIFQEIFVKVKFLILSTWSCLNKKKLQGNNGEQITDCFIWNKMVT